MAEVPNDLIREAVARGLTCRITARGHSMRPLIPDGSVCVIGPARDVRPGDVIACERGTALIIHRVLTADAARVVTRGDGARQADGAFCPRDVIGRVRVVERSDGRILDLDSGPLRRLGRAIAWIQRLRSGATTQRF